MSRRRILYVITSSDFGGAESLVEHLALAVDPQRFDCVFCSLCSLGEIGRRLAAAGVPTFDLGMAPRARAFEMTRGSARLAELLDAERIDLVHAQLYRANVLAPIAARRARRRPVVVLAQHSLTAAGGYLAAAAAWLTRPLAHHVIAVSEAVRERLLALPGISAERLSVIRNGVDTALFRPGDGAAMRAELGLPADAFVVGAVGRLMPVKGFDRLLRAVAALRRQGLPAEVVLAGDGPQRSALEVLADELEIGTHAHFLGVRRDLERVYPALDVFALTSLREASPMALLEAMAAARPVVASRVGGVPEVVVDGLSGRLFELSEPAMLSEVLGQLAADEDLRRRLGAGARRRIEESFSLEAAVRQHEELYAALLGENGRGGEPP